MSEKNLFPFVTPMGCPPGDMSDNDNASDFMRDSSGIPSVNQGEKTNMDMGLKPNTFPKQTGHDSLTEEEAQLT